MISDPSAPPETYWNPVGIDPPADRASLRNPCQLNPKTSARSQKGAVFVVDSRTGHDLIVHSGVMGGGRKGLTLSAFWDRYLLEKPVVVSGLVGDFARVVDLDGSAPLGAIARFAEEARRIKRLVREEGETSEVILTARATIPDYVVKGERTRKPPQSNLRSVDIVHDRVTDALAATLRRAGYAPKADPRGTHDILIEKPHPVLFEVKTTSSVQDVYTGVGQLLVNGNVRRPRPALVYVCPASANREPWFMRPLADLGIRIVTFRSNSGEPVINARQLGQILPLSQ